MQVTLNTAIDLLRLGLGLWALVSLFTLFSGHSGRWSVTSILLAIAYVLVLLGTLVTING